MDSKSQIALEYAYRKKENSPQISVFWINAHNTSRFRSDYLHIGRIANIPKSRDPDTDPERLVKDWLDSNQSGTWVMFVDNADDPSEFTDIVETGKPSVRNRISDLLPQSQNGCIVFTTRNKQAGMRLATANGIILLPKMDPKDAHELLKIRSGEGVPDETLAKELLEGLDYLPIAISQAGSYMAENCISVIEYLEMYKESEDSKIELLSEGFEDLAIDSKPVALSLQHGLYLSNRLKSPMFLPQIFWLIWLVLINSLSQDLFFVCTVVRYKPRNLWVC